jgi:hypothetical protein
MSMGDVRFESLTWLVIEDPDDVSRKVYGDHGEVIGYEAANLPAPYAAEAQRVLDAVDDATCAMRLVKAPGGEPLCDRPVGWVLHETDDGIGAGVRWAYTALVEVATFRTGEPPVAVAVCEDCVPVNWFEAALFGAEQAAMDAARAAQTARDVAKAPGS